MLAHAPGAAADCDLARGRDHVATAIIDAETVKLDDGSEVRLVGLAAPRAIDGDAPTGAWPAETAARDALTALVAGKSVRLKFVGDRQDRHSRWLAHLFVQDGDGRETWVQQAMLRQGHARASATRGNRACQDDLVQAEAEARREGRGLWQVPTYKVRDAAWPRDLTRALGSLQVVTGKVRHVSSRREGYRLWLDAEGRRGEITVTVQTSDRDLIGQLGGDLKSLTGKRVEVRGWLDQRRGAQAGPEIDISTAGMIAVLGQ